MSSLRYEGIRPGNARRRVIAALAAAGGILCAATSGGQVIERGKLERCAAMQSDRMKLACYEQLTSPDDGTVAPDTAASADAPAMDNAASTVDAPGPAEAGAGAPAESSGTPLDTAVDRLGSGQVKTQTDDPPLALEVAIVKVTRDRLDRLHFHFGNGQVWRQIEPRRFRYPESGEFRGIISTGMTGEFRLRISEDEPMTRIRRIK